ncbi:MAG: hypothetical protein GF409_03625 [Candidatus Omnitrophica bacterium]|nr:hypothetical protein [Candidatus Omnitrophota bacterium]
MGKIFIHNQKGLMMITAYMIIAAMSIFAAAAIKMATTEYNFAMRYFNSMKTFYLAEAAAEEISFDLADRVAAEEDSDKSALDQWNDPCLNDSDYLSTGCELESVCLVLDEYHEDPDPDSNTTVRHFLVSAKVTDPDTGKSSTVNNLLRCSKDDVFRYVIFYNEDLEILPGSYMALTGDIHCNRDIYLSTSATLRIDADNLNAAGNIYNKRKDQDRTDRGDVEIRRRDSFWFPHMWYRWWEGAPLDSRRSDWGTSSQNRWRGTVKSGVHGIYSKAVADIFSIQPDGFYAETADVTVINGDIFRGTTQLREVAYDDHNGDGTIDANDFGPNDIPEGTINTSADRFYNYREGKYIKMTDIDLKKLAGFIQVDGGEGEPVEQQLYPNQLPANGLLYATRNDATGSEQPGIRVINGARISNTDGLTLVSDAPAYIQGDFNVQNYGGDPSNKKPVAVISDALNILSNNWDDDNSLKGLGDRTADDTEVNAAFISGADETLGSTYGGGLENYPRLHENWTGRTLKIRGSFVNLWDCQVAEGQWGDSSYSAPERDWDYDPDFLEEEDLPVYTPKVVGIEKEATWVGEFDVEGYLERQS